MSSAVLGGFLFLSVSVGGWLAWLMSKLFTRSNEGLSLLCGGFLVGLLAFDLIPTAITVYNPFGIVLGILIGYLLFQLLTNLFHSSSTRNTSVYLLFIAVFLHTIPLSMTIGSLLEDSSIVVALTSSTLLHHLPEGFALATAFIAKGKKLSNLYLFFIILAVFFSGFILVGSQTNLNVKEQSILIGVSIGLIAFTSVKEFILHNIRFVSKKSFISNALIGLLLSILFHLLM